MGEGEKVVTVCAGCRFFDRLDKSCESEGAPVTDFVTGEKACYRINDGLCVYFESREKVL